MSVGTKSMPRNVVVYISPNIAQRVEEEAHPRTLTVNLISPLKSYLVQREDNKNLPLFAQTSYIVRVVKACLVNSKSSFGHLMGPPTFSRLSNIFCNLVL